MKLLKAKKSNKTPKSEGKKKLYLSVKDAVAYSGLSEHAVRKLIAEQKVPYVKTGVKYLIDRIALKKYLENMSTNHLPL